MKKYKKWSAEERRKSLVLTKRAIANGEIPHQTEIGCQRCGQKEGVIDYHNEDYSHPTKYLEALCFRCHIIHHSQWRSPEACKKYWEEIKAGKQYPPVFKRDMSIFRKDHNIT